MNIKYAQPFNLSDIEANKVLSQLFEMTKSQADLKVKDTVDFDKILSIKTGDFEFKIITNASGTNFNDLNNIKVF